MISRILLSDFAKPVLISDCFSEDKVDREVAEVFDEYIEKEYFETVTESDTVSDLIKKLFSCTYEHAPAEGDCGMVGIFIFRDKKYYMFVANSEVASTPVRNEAMCMTALVAGFLYHVIKFSEDGAEAVYKNNVNKVINILDEM